MHKDQFTLWQKCRERAEYLIYRGYPVGDVTVEQLTDLLIKLETEKAEKDKLSDAKHFYDDEIVEIEEVGDKETIDISVSGDNLFYCNDILTKNSFGLPATADFMIGLMSSEDLEALGQIAVKQLKNRWGDVGYYKRFVVGIDRPKMRLYNVEESAQQDMMDDTPTMDKGDVGDRIGAERDEFDSFRGRKKRNNFGDFV